MANRNFVYDIILNIKENVSKQLDTANSKFDKLFDGTRIGDFKNQLTDAFSKVRGAVSVAGAAVTGLVAGIGLITAGMYEAYKANQQLNKELKQLKSLFKDVDTTTLINAKNRIEALAESTEENSKLITIAVNNLAKAYKVSLTEALKFYEEAVIRGGNANLELTASIEEFSVQAKEAGLSMQQFQNLLVNSPAEGIYKDKLADLIKEINVVSTDFNKIKNDLKGVFDQPTIDKQIEGLKNGTITAIQFYTNVNEKAKELGKTAEEVTAINRTLFGSLAEDVGTNAYDIIIKSIKDTNKGLTDLQKTTLDEQRASAEFTTSYETFLLKLDALTPTILKVKTFFLDLGAAILQSFNNGSEAVEKYNKEVDRIKNIDSKTATKDTQREINEKIIKSEKDLNKLYNEELETKKKIKLFEESGQLESEKRERDKLDNVKKQIVAIKEFQKVAATTSAGIGESTGSSSNKGDVANLNKFRQASKQIALDISQDRIKAKLDELDALKSLDETQLEQLKDRQDKELALTKDLYAKQLAEANLAADEQLANNLKKNVNELTKEDRIKSLKEITEISKQETTEQGKAAREQLLIINKSYAESASIRLEQEAAIRDIKIKYDKEELQRIQSLNESYNQISLLRLSQEDIKLKIFIKQSDNLTEQIELSNKLYDNEKKRIDLVKEQALIEVLNKGGTANSIDLSRQLNVLKEQESTYQKVVDKVKELDSLQDIINNKVREGLSVTEEVRKRGQGIFSESSGNKARGLAKEVDLALKSIGANILTSDVGTSVKTAVSIGLTELNELLIKNKKQQSDLVNTSLEEVAKNSEKFGKEAATAAAIAIKNGAAANEKALRESATNQLQLQSESLNKSISLYEAYYNELERLIDTNEDKNNELAKLNVKRSINNIKDILKGDFVKEEGKSTFQSFADNIGAIFENTYRKKRNAINEVLFLLEKERELLQKQNDLQTKSKFISGKTETITIDTTGLTEEEAKAARDKAVKKITEQYETIKSIVIIEETNLARIKQGFVRTDAEITDAVREKLKAQGIVLNDEELAEFIRFGTKRNAINTEFNKKITEADKSDAQIRLDNTKEFFQKVSEVGQGVANVVKGVFDIINMEAQLQLAQIQETIAKLDEQITVLNDAISESESKLSDLKSVFEESTGKRKADALKLYDTEVQKILQLKAAEAGLTAQKKSSEEEAKKVQAGIEERAKSLAVINQIVATSSIIAASAGALEKAFSKSATVWDGIAGAVAAIAAITSLYASAKSVAKFEDGGLVKGARHSQGGVPFTVAGQGGFEMEGGEYIMSRKTVERVGLNNLDALNFNRAVPQSPKARFETGGIVQAITNQNQLDINDRLDYMISQNNALLNKDMYVSVTDVNRTNSVERNRMISSTF